MRNYYDILAVAQNATTEQIKKRFYDLARGRHPDVVAGDGKARAELEFQDLTEAFNVLSDPERRRQHDLELAQPSSESRGADKQRLVQLFLRQGVAAYKAQSYLEAADLFRRSTEIEPENALAWYNLAQACSHHGRWLSQAMTAASKACELEPMNTKYLKLAGRLFQEGGLTHRAEKFYNRALSWGDDDPSIHEALKSLKKGS